MKMRGHDYLPDDPEDDVEEVSSLLPEPAEEGSFDRKHARYVLVERAKAARAQGSSFIDWQDKQEQHLLDAVSQQDLDTIFELVWRGNLLRMREG